MSIQPGVGYTFTASSQGTNFSIQTPWAPWPLLGDSFECSPYKVHDVVEKGSGESAYAVFQICSATFNNLIPQVYDSVNEVWEYLDELASDAELVLDFASTSTSYVYLRVGPEASGGSFPPAAPSPTDPDDPYPRIYSTGTALPADSDEFGYLLIALVTNTSGVYTVTNYITGSLWGDRIKLGTNTASYYYARI
jgi:hypothetical protein